MARFDDFEAAPLNQSTLDRLGRGTAATAIGGVKGAIAGALAISLGLGLVVGGYLYVAGAVTAGAATVLGVAIAAVAGWFGATTAALFGGVWGAAKGYSEENQRAGLDQSLYNAVVAEAVTRGSAQGQALAYTQQPMPAQAAFIPPQPQAQVRQQPEAPVELSPAANDNAAPTTGSPAKVAAKDAAYEGTVIASKQLASQL